MKLYSSPEFPQSNGLAENAVKRAKQLLDKTQKDNCDPHLALLNLRNVPRDMILGSPSQRLLSRRTNTTVPTNTKLLRPQTTRHQHTAKQIKHLRQTQKRYFDKSARGLPTLKEGDVVRMQTTKGYNRKATVQRVHDTPRSYIVQSDGTNYRRNRRHLLSVPQEASMNIHVPNSNNTSPRQYPSTPTRIPITPPRNQSTPMHSPNTPQRIPTAMNQPNIPDPSIPVRNHNPMMPTPESSPTPQIRRSGRTVRKPIKLDL